MLLTCLFCRRHRRCSCVTTRLAPPLNPQHRPLESRLPVQQRGWTKTWRRLWLPAGSGLQQHHWQMHQRQGDHRSACPRAWLRSIQGSWDQPQGHHEVHGVSARCHVPMGHRCDDRCHHPFCSERLLLPSLVRVRPSWLGGGYALWRERGQRRRTSRAQPLQPACASRVPRP